MSNFAVQGPEPEIAQLHALLAENELIAEIFVSEGFDGATLATLIIDLTQILAPPVAAVFAAKVASKKEIKLKVRGVEVSAGSKEEVLKVLAEVTKNDAGEEDDN